MGKALTKRVYPRVYGGTDYEQALTELEKGLSPRVRGNRPAHLNDFFLARSIPACTGEPVYSTIPTPLNPVYPRVYGGTCRRTSTAAADSGLSPRVRGNPVDGRLIRRAGRSIPACTGEPNSGADQGEST